MDERDPASNSLAERSEERGTDDTGGTTREKTSVMVFRRGPHWYAVRALDVRAVGPAARPVALPRTPHFVRGVVNQGGRIAPVLELPLLLGIGGAPEPDDGRSLVLEVAASYFIVHCDEVAGISEIVLDGVQRTEGTGPAIGTLILANRTVTLLEGARILAAAEAEGAR